MFKVSHLAPTRFEISTNNWSRKILIITLYPETRSPGLFHDCLHNMFSITFSISTETNGKVFSLAVSAANDQIYYKTPKATFTGGISESVHNL